MITNINNFKKINEEKTIDQTKSIKDLVNEFSDSNHVFRHKEMSVKKNNDTYTVKYLQKDGWKGGKVILKNILDELKTNLDIKITLIYDIA